MSSENIDVAALFHRGDWKAAAALSSHALDTGAAEDNRALLLAILCMSLYALGRPEDAAAAYARNRKTLKAEVDHRELRLRATAAAAAGHPDIGPLLDLLFPDSPASSSPFATYPVTTLAQWCAARSIPVRMMDPLEDASEAAPLPYVFVSIAGAEVVSGRDFVLTPDGSLIADSGYMPLARLASDTPHFYVPDVELVAFARPEEVVAFDCDALFLSAPDKFHVGHFLVDFLPRLRCLKSLPADMKVFLPSNVPEKFFELIACFGVNRDRIITCDPGQRCRFRSLTVTQVSPGALPHPNNIKYLRNALATQRREDSRTRGYFLDRSVATRQVVNRAEMDAVLAEFGITHISLHSMTIAEQREAMAKAHVLIAAYGSELLACLFAPPGTHAIELVTYLREATAEWCRQSGVAHQYLECVTAGSTALKRMKKDHDMIVDCAHLRERLAAIFAVRVD